MRLMDLELAERFTIARETWDVASNVFVLVSYGEHTGVGEVSPDERWDETPSSVTEQLRSVDLGQLAGPFDLEGVSELLPPGSARCALDMAVHDLAASTAGISVAELLGVGGRAMPPTSFTLPIADVGAMVARAQAHASYPILKMKVGFDGDVDAVAAVREVYGGTIRIDANEGWSVDDAVSRLPALERFDIELCEQPIHAGNHEGLRRVTESTAIRVFADEDVGTASDVAALAGIVDGVNLKLRKAGGIREVVRAIASARALDLGVMLGCDLESGVAATAGASIGPLVDHLDMDGPLLLAKDPFPGVTYDNGHLTLPGGPGLGLKVRPS